jgi:hypothetical protein
MGKLENEKQALTCPKCRRSISISIYDMINRGEAKCDSCGSSLKFSDSNIRNNLRSATSNLENAQIKFAEALQQIISKADVFIKH